MITVYYIYDNSILHISFSEPGMVSDATFSMDSTEITTVEVNWNPIADYPCPGMNYMVEYELISKDQCQLETTGVGMRLAEDITESSARVTGLQPHSTYVVYIKATHPAGHGQPVKLFVQAGESG